MLRRVSQHTTHAEPVTVKSESGVAACHKTMMASRDETRAPVTYFVPAGAEAVVPLPPEDMVEEIQSAAMDTRA